MILGFFFYRNPEVLRKLPEYPIVPLSGIAIIVALILFPFFFPMIKRKLSGKDTFYRRAFLAYLDVSSANRRDVVDGTSLVEYISHFRNRSALGGLFGRLLHSLVFRNRGGNLGSDHAGHGQQAAHKHQSEK